MKIKAVVQVLGLMMVFVVVPAFSAETTMSFDIENMDCALCPVTVRTAMEKVSGVVKAEVDFDSKTATVTFDDAKTSAEEIASASTNAGYPATLHNG